MSNSNANNTNKNTNAAVNGAAAKLGEAVGETIFEAIVDTTKEVSMEDTTPTRDPELADIRAIEERVAELDKSAIIGAAIIGGAVCAIGRITRKAAVAVINSQTESTFETESWTSIVGHSAAVAVTAAGTQTLVQKTVLKNVNPGYNAGVAGVVGTGVNLVDALFGDQLVAVSGKAYTGLFGKKEQAVEVTEEAVVEAAAE